MTGLHAAAGLALAIAMAGCALFEHAEPTIITGGDSPTLIPDVPFVFSAEPVVEAMLDIAGVRAGDLVYDLGCGDGRIVIAAAKRGARATGIDIDPVPLNFARAYARRAGVDVEKRVRLVRGDFFQADLRDATVVTLYLSPEVNQRLLPKLLAELAPGSRIVSHKFHMGEAWKPDRSVRAGDATVYLWIVPAGKPPGQGGPAR
jgi:cyclopropane fatty-acyl-phospholipid synthase-like methyltransferase